MDRMLFQPGKTNVKASSQIPILAETGMANASAEPFTAPPDQGGRLYSPAIYTTFIVAAGVDIAVTNVVPSNSQVLMGSTVTISVKVLNTGNETVTFDLSVYYNETLIETRRVTQLAPLSQSTLTFNWNTSAVSPGFYQLSASAPLAGDPTPSDNTYVDGLVQVARAIFPTLDWWVVWILIVLGGFAGIITLFLILALGGTRRRKRSRATYTVIAHPHI
jgi:hypothetical protein